MKKISSLVSTLIVGGAWLAAQQPQKPNVVLVIADDLGFGDVSAYGSKTISTPNIDSLARGGACFTNAYATSATSTPSRYGMFTGVYPWRNPEARILPGDAPLIIREDEYTMPKMLRNAGYATGAIGKWHLGMGRGKNRLEQNGETGRKPDRIRLLMPHCRHKRPCADSIYRKRRCCGARPRRPHTSGLRKKFPRRAHGY